MAKQKFVVLYPIGAGEKNQHETGAEVELDPDHKDTQRWLKAKAIARPQDLKQKVGKGSGSDELKAAEAKVSELETELGKATEAVQAEAKRADEAEAKVSELEKALEAAKGKASK